ncbi:MAG TPA: hypothetical protein VNL71_21715 [Chloroflexota bacterium]|nr:hypothetical protein [Chloroflexota bacterium]
MRCLRCALDYGPEEQFCQRCGRSLSRPLGSKGSAEEKNLSTPQEAQFFYTTTAPPPLQGAEQGTGEPVAWEMPKPQAGMASAPVLEQPHMDEPAPSDTFDELGFPVSADPQTIADGPLPPPPLDLSVHAGLTLKRATGGLSAAANARGIEAGDPVAPTEAPLAAPPMLDDFFGDGDEDEGSALVPSGFGKSGAGSRSPKLSRGGRQGAQTAATGPNRRALSLVVIALIVIIALGGYAFLRQRAYNNDLTNARNLALGGPSQYSAAINRYNQAIAEWPFNSGAKAGLAAVQASENSAQAAAQAAARQLAQTDATRGAMYEAHMALIQQELANQP